MKTRTLRTVGAAAALTLAAGIGLVAASTSASAIGAPYTGTPIGFLDLRPATGNNQSIISYTTSAPCPAGASAFNTRLYGNGLPDTGQVVTAATSAGFSNTQAFQGDFGQTPQTYADQNNTTLQGTYDVVLSCTARSSTSLGDFRSQLTFTTPTAYTSVRGPAPGAPAATPTATMSPSATPTATTSPTSAPTTAPPTTAPPTTSPPTTAPPSASPTRPPSPSSSPSPVNPCLVPASVSLSQTTIISTGRSTATVRAAASSTVELYAYTQPSRTYRLVRTGVTSTAGTVAFDVVPPANTRLYAVVRGCTVNEPRDSRVLNVRTAFTLFVTRTGTRSYRFSGDSIPARPRGLIVSLYRVTSDGRQVLTSQTRADGVDGTWEIDRTFLGEGRFGFVVRAGQDLQNAPGTSNVRSLLIF